MNRLMSSPWNDFSFTFVCVESFGLYKSEETVRKLGTAEEEEGQGASGQGVLYP